MRAAAPKSFGVSPAGTMTTSSCGLIPSRPASAAGGPAPFDADTVPTLASTFRETSGRPPTSEAAALRRAAFERQKRIERATIALDRRAVRQALDQVAALEEERVQVMFQRRREHKALIDQAKVHNARTRQRIFVKGVAAARRAERHGSTCAPLQWCGGDCLNGVR